MIMRKRHITSGANDYISRDYFEILVFIKTASSKKKVERLHIGLINDRTANIVKKLGINISDYDVVLASNYIAHIFAEHGTQRTETPRNQIAVNYDNIQDVIETLISPDKVSIAESGSNGTLLRFEKKTGDRNVALTLVSTKKSTLSLKSAWIIQSNGGRAPSANDISFARTPETNGRSPVNNSIAPSVRKSNPSGEKSSKQIVVLQLM